MNKSTLIKIGASIVVAVVVATTAIIKRVRKIRNTGKSVENDKMNQTTKETNDTTSTTVNEISINDKQSETAKNEYTINDDEYYCKYSIDIPDLDKEKDQHIITRLADIIINKLKEEIKIEKEFVESGKPWDLYFAQSFAADRLFTNARRIADIIDNEETSKEILDLLDKITEIGETYRRMHGKENKL